MIRGTPKCTRTDKLLPYTTLVRSIVQIIIQNVDIPIFIGRIVAYADQDVDVTAAEDLGVVACEDDMLTEVGLPPWQTGDPHFARRAIADRRIEVDDLDVSEPREVGHVVGLHLDRKSTRLNSSH